MQVDGNTITMINGDSETITVSCIDIDGLPCDFDSGDTVYFTLKKTNSDINSIPDLQKTITVFQEGKAIINLIPSDTINLSGGYEYDIEVKRLDGTVTTIIKPSQFIINLGVTT